MKYEISKEAVDTLVAWANENLLTKHGTALLNFLNQNLKKVEEAPVESKEA